MSSNDKSIPYYDDEGFPPDNKEADHPTIVKVKIPLRKRLAFLARLEYDDLSQREFFDLCMRAYIYNMNGMREIVNRHKMKKGTISKEEVRVENENFRDAQKKEDFLFSEEELEEIFSIVEEDDRTF